MRVAARCDIHGNLPALDAVRADVGHAAVALIVIGGDVFSGPLPAETLQRLLELGDRLRVVRGNADCEVVAAPTASSWQLPGPRSGS